MKLKYIILEFAGTEHEFIEKISSCIGYKVEKEDPQNIDLKADIYYLLMHGDSDKVVTPENVHKMILVNRKPIILFDYMMKNLDNPAAIIYSYHEHEHTSPFFREPHFWGVKEAFNNDENQLMKDEEDQEDDKYGFFKSTIHKTYAPMLVDYLEGYDKYLKRIGKV